MSIVIKKPETEDEIRGKAHVYWRASHEAFAGIVSSAWLESLTLEKCEQMAFRRTDDILIAKDDERVVGFVSYGDRGSEAPGVGEIFSLYLLPEYFGTGLSRRLMDAGLAQLADYPKICLWVLADNGRAIRFYEKCDFSPDGEEAISPRTGAKELRMVLKHGL